MPGDMIPTSGLQCCVDAVSVLSGWPTRDLLRPTLGLPRPQPHRLPWTRSGHPPRRCRGDGPV